MLMQALDTFIGLVSVFLILSLIVSALGEGVSGWFNFKGKNLKKSIGTLLDESTAEAFFEHDAIRRLQKDGWHGPRLPSYIPDTVIADVIVDLCVNRRPEGESSNDDTGDQRQPITPNTVNKALSELDAGFATTLRNLWQKSQYDVATFKSLIADWFNLTGDRSTGWFRRKLAFSLFVVGFVVSMALNADTLYMFNALSNDDSLRESFVEYATDLVDEARAAEIPCEDDACRALVQRFVEGAEPSSDESTQLATLCDQPDGLDADACRTQLAGKLDVQQQVCSALDVEGECSLRNLISGALPEVTPLLGFDLLTAELKAIPEEGQWSLFWLNNHEWAFWFLKVIGWFLTAAAVSLGAPFWFDLLQKIVQIRSSMKPTASTPATVSGEKSEASTAQVPRARAVIRASATDAVALDDLGHFDARTFGFSPLNIFWSARLSKLAYAPDAARIAAELEDWGAEGELLDREGSQCIVARTPKAAFLSFRGTENKVEDWLTDAEIPLRAPAWHKKSGYQVHTGFDKGLESIWSDDPGGFQGIGTKLTEMGVFEQKIPIWLSGHSLGGALAALGALRLAHFLAANKHGNIIGGVHTFGQPRVGDPACAAALEQAYPARYFRSVNNRDIVPRVPLPATPDIYSLITKANEKLPDGEPKLQVLDYAHAGRVIYFNDMGKAMMDPPIWYRSLDTLVVGTTMEQIKTAARETAGDHSMDKYVELQRGMLDVAVDDVAA